MKMIIVMPYELLRSKEKTILVSYLSSVDIDHEGMKKVLESLPKKEGWFQEEELVTLLEENSVPPDTGIEFLMRNGLVKKMALGSGDLWKQVLIISDNISVFNEDVQAWYGEGIDVYDLRDINNIPSVLPDDTLVWVHLETYRNELIRQVYETLKVFSNVAFVQSYFTKEIFRIDGVYSPRFGTPCHYCHVERWLNREQKSFGANSVSWGNLLSLLKENSMSLPAISLKKTEREFVRHIIKRRMQELIGNSLVNMHVDTFFSSVCTDIITCIPNREPVIHWYACDCIGS